MPGETENPLTENEISIRDKFADEYLSDYDPVGAAIRIGYVQPYADQYAKVFFNCPYTKRKIRELEEAVGGGSEKDRHRKRVTTMLYREANSYRPGGGSRVGALNGIRQMHGLDEPTKVELTTKQSPIQFYIPSNGRDKPEQPVESLDTLVELGIAEVLECDIFAGMVLPI